MQEKIIQVIHNPSAGNGEHSKEQLTGLFSALSGHISYVSTKDKGWEKFPEEGADIIYIAGGDGTIRKAAKILFRSKVPENWLPPLGFLPLGTANNIAETLEIPSNEVNPELDPEGAVRPLDCGRVKGLQETGFFIESVGVGLFPELIHTAEKKEIEAEEPEVEIKRVLRSFRNIVKNYQARKAKIKADGIRIKGSFLMVEVMNMRSIGPSLELAPFADPGDGFFDLIMISEKDKPALLAYLEDRINDKESAGSLRDFVKTIRVRKVKIKWEGSKIHVDDELIDDYDGKSIKIKMVPGAFQVLR